MFVEKRSQGGGVRRENVNLTSRTIEIVQKWSEMFQKKLNINKTIRFHYNIFPFC